MFFLVVGILMVGVFSVTLDGLEKARGAIPDGGGRGGGGDPTPGKIDFCGEIFNSLDSGSSPDGGGGCGSGDPAPG